MIVVMQAADVGARRQRHDAISLAPQALMQALLCHGSVVGCTGVLGAHCSGVLHPGRSRRALPLRFHQRRNEAAGTTVSVTMQAAYVTRARPRHHIADVSGSAASVCMLFHGSVVAGALGAAASAAHGLDADCAHCAASGGARVHIVLPLEGRVHMNPAHAPWHKPSHV